MDRNGCDTRNDVLRRDLVEVVLKSDSNGCAVLTGVLHDPYIGETLLFDRADGSSSKIHIDHVVSLSDAWQKGAQQMSLVERTAFANDPLNLAAAEQGVPL